MVFSSLFVSISAMTLYSIRLGVIFSKLSDGNQEILVEATLFSNVPLVFFTQVFFLLRRSALLAFFADWRQQLIDIDCEKRNMPAVLEKKIILIYCIYFSFSLLSFLAIGIMVLNDREIMNHLASVIAFGPYAYYVYFILFCSSFIVSVFCSLIDIVPSFLYYRAGVAVQVLVDQWKSSLLQKDSAKFQKIVLLYNSIGSLATRADYLFGPLIVLNHGIMFFFICTLTSTILKPSLWARSDSLRYLLLANLVFFLARLIWPIMFMSKLHGSSERLKAAVLSSFSRTIAENQPNKKSSTEDITTNKSIKKFAFLLVNKSLLACPSELYCITPSIFLTMLSLLATYTIIILQSK